MMLEAWTEWLDQYEHDGYFVARGVLGSQDVERLRGHIDQALASAQDTGKAGTTFGREVGAQASEDDPAELTARFRKIGQLGFHNTDFWNDFHCHPNVIGIMRRLLGENIRLMFSSAFLKTAHHGGATPWHQDVGLWEHKLTTAPSIWMAIDPATRENGCLQFVPGSHRAGEVEHVLYDGGVHKEIRRDLLAHVEPVHVELGPGDAAVWTAAMFHYSPPNESEHSRLGVAGVYCSQPQFEALGLDSDRQFPWIVKDGIECWH